MKMSLSLLVFSLVLPNVQAQAAKVSAATVECVADYNWLTQHESGYIRVEKGNSSKTIIDSSLRSRYRFLIRGFGLVDGSVSLEIDAFDRKGRRLSGASGLVLPFSVPQAAMAEVRLSVGSGGQSEVQISCRRMSTQTDYPVEPEVESRTESTTAE